MDYITKLCRRQAEIIHNQENENVVSNNGQSKTTHTQNVRGLNLAAVTCTTAQVP
jgi:hypothetical protein